MDRTRWTWFAFGLVLGLVLGGSAVGTYYAVQLHEARDQLDRANEVVLEMMKAEERQLREAIERREEARKELERAEKARKDR